MEYLELLNINVLLQNAVQYIDMIVGGNEFAAGAIIAGMMGIATYTARAIPSRIFQQVKKHTTTTLEMNSTNISYHQFAKFLQDKGFADKSRYIKVGNGFYGSDSSVKQIGYGVQLFWVNWYTPIIVNSYKEDSQSKAIKEFIVLTKLGRDHAYFDKMLIEVADEAEDHTVTKFNKYEDGYQEFITTLPKRRLDTIALPQSSIDKLLAAIDSFVTKEEWYVKHQIPYQLGILLFGPPGTGKTSLIKAIAAYMDKDICYVDSEAALTSAAQNVNNTIIVVEEVDTMTLGKRESDDDGQSNVDEILGIKPKKKEEDELTKAFSSLEKRTLGKVLNALDGIISNHGRVIVLTTNHADVLDPALLRPGRIDLQLEIGFMDSETLNKMIKRFFPDYEERNVEVIYGVSPADVQNDVILGLGPNALLQKYTKNNLIVLEDEDNGTE